MRSCRGTGWSSGPRATSPRAFLAPTCVATLAGHRSTAVLMRNHGVFTIGTTALAAVKSAVLCEDVARTVHLARQLGDPLPIRQDHIDSMYNRYQNIYGQG
jgi:L-ribulose-5-phosphate 4-epimerase